MVNVRIDAGVCGFITQIAAHSEDNQNVTLEITSTCPHVTNAAPGLTSVDAYTEIFTKPAATRTYEALSPHLPHVACPVYAGVLKAIEAAAGLALPRDSSIVFVEDSAEEGSST
jgi:hypothetical protein